MSDTVYDVVIIGGGPAGLSAAQYAARANLTALVIDKSPTAGALAYTNRIENYPGLQEPVSGKDLLDIFRKQAIAFGAELVEKQVIGVKLEGDVKEVHTMDLTYLGKAVIVATGAMGRKPTIKGEGEFLGRGVSYCAICDAAFYRDKTVCVIGDSEEAVKEAGLLAGFADLVYLVTPSSRLKVGDDYPTLKKLNLRVLSGYRVTSIEGNEVVERIRMIDSEERETELELSGVFVYLHGNKAIIDFLGGSVELSEEECLVTNRMMETSISGVFAAGDVICAEVRQVVIAASNGCIAALSAEKYIHHKKRRKYDWAK